MLIFLTFFVTSNLQQTDIDSCQVKNVFDIKKFEMTSQNVPRSGIISYIFYAQLTSQVENPYLETQILSDENRLPVFRNRDALCRDDVLNCPASHSNIIYKNQIHLPATLITGNYMLRFIFREGKQSISCYEKSFQITEKNTLSSTEKKNE